MRAHNHPVPHFGGDWTGTATMVAEGAGAAFIGARFGRGRLAAVFGGPVLFGFGLSTAAFGFSLDTGFTTGLGFSTAAAFAAGAGLGVGLGAGLIAGSFFAADFTAGSFFTTGRSGGFEDSFADFVFSGSGAGLAASFTSSLTSSLAGVGSGSFLRLLVAQPVMKAAATVAMQAARKNL